MGQPAEEGQQVIIVEGPDGAGKTRLVERIADAYQLRIGQRSTTDRNHVKDYARVDTYIAVMRAVAVGHDPVVWDRLLYSSMIYDQVFGRKPAMTVAETNYLHRLICAMNAPVIVCLPPYEVVERHVAMSEQMDGVVENLPQLFERYSLMVRETESFVPGGLRVFGYDWTRADSWVRIARIIDIYLKHRKERSFT